MNKITIGIQNRPQLRESAETGRIIFGYAIVFNKESLILSDGFDNFREIIKPEAVTMADLKTYDITMTAFHNREKLMARWKKGVGTLKLSIDKIGVKYEFEAAKTALGDEILSAVKRGDMIGSSFTFSSYGTKYNDSVDRDGITRRTITKLGVISEMTIAANPAYPDTTVESRELNFRSLSEKQSNEDLRKSLWRRMLVRKVNEEMDIL